MRIICSLLAILAAPSIAVAEPKEKIDVALAANAPLRWGDADSVGLSGYLAIAKRQAIRINVASYTPPTNVLLDVLAFVALGADPGDATERGRITDVGVGYQYYPRQLFKGPTLEAGLLLRHVNLDVNRYGDEEVDTKGDGIAARALVGWSWLFWQRLFVSTAIGASAGRYTGTERSAFQDDPVMTTNFVRYETALEAYFRVGVAFEL